MKIAIVWNYGSRLGDCSFRFEEYVRGFEHLGHEATVVCPVSSDDGFEVPKTLARDQTELESDAFWADLAVDIAVIPTFHQMTRLLRVVRRAGPRIIALGDSDGQRGLRVFPWETMRSMVLADGDRRSQAARLRHFLKRWLRSWRTLDSQDAEFLESTRLSDVVTLASSEAIANFSHFLEHYGEDHLLDRLALVPLAIHRTYVDAPLPTSKKRELVAVGRFGSPQKNAPLLARALERVLTSDASLEKVTIFDAGNSPVLGRLAERFPRVTHSPPCPPPVLAEVHARARSIILSSRWEGSPPHAAWEAAAMGATVVATPIPAFRSWAREHPWTRVATSHTPRALAAAIAAELRAWDEGHHDPGEISGHWRSAACAENVCAAMLEALERVSPRTDSAD